MDTVQSLPTVPLEKHHSSSTDEKINEKGDDVSVVQSVYGDVFDDRAIDLDENGKERPIGECTAFFTPIPA